MSYELAIMNMSGKVVKKKPLAATLFGVDQINEALLHQYVVMYLANQRVAIAHTKTRAEVRGSGKKLYKQKGSGRARVGEAASPIRKGGGVAFGPRSNANFTLTMPKKMKKQALSHALSLKVRDTQIVGLDAFSVEKPQTKIAAQTLQALGVDTKKVLFVVDTTDAKVLCSFRNMPKVTTVNVRQLNPYQILTHHTVVFLEGAIDALESHVLSA
jgi:large subunit ribosomal protein L4